MQNPPVYRIGEGHDRHRTVEGRPLMIGGVDVEASFGLDGHSDADVLIHAVIDALLGATGYGDIGEWFPDTDENWKSTDSGDLLRHVRESVVDGKWKIQNLDCTISAEQPKLSDWKPVIRKRLAALLEVSTSVLNVKAKSGEKVGPIGRGEAIEADVVVLLCQESPKESV
ncbi:MAG: 2-C-methyl-D-erythritol 2,4-cyclodiphosphate synthase [Fuerstiella sp.]|nr:2-C-methyl-D-erythritol 2,4-cyclodiphosphate synthase [Fuerstiella sp.]